MYCLSWISYKNNICNGFAQLQQKEEFVDMTLVAEGHLVKVHKNLISLASPYIKNVIKSVPCTHPIIFLANITHDILCHLLEYIYTGEVHVEIKKLNDFLKAAKELQLPGIANDLSQAATLDKGRCDNAVVSLPLREKINIIENRRSDAAIGSNTSNINDILHINIPPSQNDQNNLDLQFAESLSSGNNAPVNLDSLPINKIQILENRLLEGGTSDAAIKTKTNDIILDIDMALLENDRNNHSLPLETSLIHEQNTNTSETDIQLLENRLQDYTTSEAVPETNNMKNMLHSNVSSSRNNDNNYYDYSHTVTVSKLDDADNFDEFLKFPDPPNSEVTLKENSVTNQQMQKLEVIDPINEEAQLKFTLAFENDILPQQYTVSNRGSLQMVLNRYIYSMHYSANGGVKRRWRCIDYRIMRCGAYVDTINDKITERKNCHTHPFHDSKIMKKIKANLIFGTLNTAIDETKKFNNMQDAVLDNTDSN